MVPLLRCFPRNQPSPKSSSLSISSIRSPRTRVSSSGLRAEKSSVKRQDLVSKAVTLMRREVESLLRQKSGMAGEQSCVEACTPSGYCRADRGVHTYDEQEIPGPCLVQPWLDRRCHAALFLPLPDNRSPASSQRRQTPGPGCGSLRGRGELQQASLRLDLSASARVASARAQRHCREGGGHSREQDLGGGAAGRGGRNLAEVTQRRGGGGQAASGYVCSSVLRPEV